MTLIAITFLLVGYPLFSDGMFCDGLWYSAISNNLSDGVGDFWNLKFTETLYPLFREHPPLGFGIQSLFFDVFGDSRFVERFYSLFTFVVTGYIMVIIWRSIVEEKYYYLSWFPLIIWIIIPTVSWGIPNNMLENTMMIFTSLSLLFMVKFYNTESLFYIVLSGISMWLGFLVKGPVALFTLSIPFWMFIFIDKVKFKNFISVFSILLVSLIFTVLFTFWVFPDSYSSILAYLEKQVVISVTSIKTVESRFYIVSQLLLDLLPSTIIVGLILFFTRKKVSLEINNKIVFVFIGIGLSGVVPMMISMKQRGFYIIHVYPIFAIILALLVVSNLDFILKKINVKSLSVYKRIVQVLLVVGVVISVFSTTQVGREQKMLHDVYSITKVVPENIIISIDKSLKNDMYISGYFYRYGRISLDSKDGLLRDYYLAPKGGKVKAGYEKIELDLESFDLFKVK